MRRLSRSILVLLALLLAAHADDPVPAPASSHAPEAEIIQREFDVLPRILSKFGPDGRSGSSHFYSRDSTLDGFIAEERALKTVFEEFGVTWPAGSQVQYRALLGVLRVWNTEANLTKIDDTLVTLLIKPFQFQIEATYLTMEKHVGDALSMTGSLNVLNVKKAWRDGKATILANPRMVTQSGQEATIKVVREISYPVRFGYEKPSDAHGTSSNAVTSTMVPTAFETREVGALFSVLPEINPEGTMIHLSIAPQYVNLTAWNEHTTTTQTENQIIRTTCKRPIFKSYGAKTSVVCKDGATILISADVGYPDDGHYLAVLARVTLVGADGLPLRRQQPNR
jgi:hypothetical protein